MEIQKNIDSTTGTKDDFFDTQIVEHLVFCNDCRIGQLHKFELDRNLNIKAKSIINVRCPVCGSVNVSFLDRF